VGDTAAPARPAKLAQHRLHRTAHVQDHRQTVAAGEFELRDEEFPLPRRIDIGHEVIKPDLADCVRSALRQQRVKPVEVIHARLRHIERMDAERRADVAARGGECAHRIEAVAVDRRNDEAAHAGTACLGDESISIAVELGRVEMNVRVDQHGRSAPWWCSLSAP